MAVWSCLTKDEGFGRACSGDDFPETHNCEESQEVPCLNFCQLSWPIIRKENKFAHLPFVGHITGDIKDICAIKYPLCFGEEFIATQEEKHSASSKNMHRTAYCWALSLRMVVKQLPVWNAQDNPVCELFHKPLQTNSRNPLRN